MNAIAEPAVTANDRTKFIGGSDAAAAVGLCPWKSPVDLWLEKTGRKAPADLSENESVQWGTILEPIIRDRYRDVTGHIVSDGDFVVSKIEPWLCANVDGYALPLSDLDNPILLEIKTAGPRQAHHWGEPGTDAVPQNYVCQIMHYLAVTELKSADLAVLVGGQKFRIYHVPRDEQLIEWLLTREAAFWRHVKTDTPPDERRIGDAAKLFPNDFGRSVTASTAIQQALRDYEACVAAMAQLDTKADGYRESIQTYMGDAAELVDDQGQPLVTWKSFTTTRIDTSALQKEHPDLVAEYRRTTSCRRFNVKARKE